MPRAKKVIVDPARIKAVEATLDRHFDGMLITTECLSKDQINRGILRMADYSTDCDYGSTYKVGTIDDIEAEVKLWLKRNGISC